MLLGPGSRVPAQLQRANRSADRQARLLQPHTSRVLLSSLVKCRPRLLSLPAGVRQVLQQCYGDPAAVDDELVDIILTPGLQPGAVDVFLDFISYSSGPLPEQQLEVGSASGGRLLCGELWVVDCASSPAREGGAAAGGGWVVPALAGADCCVKGCWAVGWASSPARARPCPGSSWRCGHLRGFVGLMDLAQPRGPSRGSGRLAATHPGQLLQERCLRWCILPAFF